MKSLIAVPFLIGSLPILGSVAIGYNYLKSKKDSKYLYWGGLTASAFVGWSLSTILYAKYAKSVAKSAIMGGESFSAEEKKIVELLVEMDNDSMVDGNVEYIIDLINEAGMNILSVKDMNAESFSAESKYIKPYDKAKGFDLKRDNKGRYRRQLVIPLKKDAESDGWFSVSFTSNEKQANTDKKGFEDGDVGFGFVDSYSDYRYKIMENSDKQGWTVLAQSKNN